jgi:serine/threonine protein kinase
MKKEAHPSRLRVGEQIGDFEIVRLLGQGSFAQVFLARQISLGRLVALKATVHHGTEARALAHLEHDHIVRIFAESVDAERGLRLLCMQYVPGPTLQQVMRRLIRQAADSWSGRAFLDTIDAECADSAIFDPAAARDRELLGSYDFVECVCWVGSRLAEALAHAHRQGILHRDIKPANILLTPYGRPLLADFNLATAPEPVRGQAPESFGGTLPYMAPEHLEALDSAHRVGSLGHVDERSDIYSLGVVLCQLVTGRLPSQPPSTQGNFREALGTVIAERRGGKADLLAGRGISEGLAHVIGLCLEGEPEHRYQTAAELARALEGSRELRRAAKDMPAAGRLVRSVERHPFVWLAVLAFLPHVIASVVNISYNGLRIDLTEAQRRAFGVITVIYNLLVYPLCLWLLWSLMKPVAQSYRGLGGRLGRDAAQVAGLRQRILRLPRAVAILSAIGWLPGGVLFPRVLDYYAGPISGAVYGQFLISFSIAGLIALTYSVFGVQFVVLRVLYPRLWGDGQDFRQRAGRELALVPSRLWVLQLLAGLIPLAAAAVLLSTSSEQLSGTSYRDFRFLITGLICLGAAGFVLAVSVSSFLNRTLAALTGAERRLSGKGTPDKAV